MTDRPFPQGPAFDPDERRDLQALGIAPRQRADCPDPALVLALEEDVLDADVATRVRAHVRSCTACQVAASDLAKVFDEEVPAETRRRIEARLAPIRPKPARGFWSWLVPAGGLALATAGLMWALMPPPNAPAVLDSQIAKATAPPPTVFVVDRPAIPPGEVDLAVRGEPATPADIDNKVALALDQADAGDLNGAMSELDGLAKKHGPSRLAGLALGALQLRDNRNAEALATLERARALTGHPGMTDEIDWFLSIALVRNGQRDRARGLLEAVCTHGAARSARACAGVAELNRSPSR